MIIVVVVVPFFLVFTLAIENAPPSSGSEYDRKQATSLSLSSVEASPRHKQQQQPGVTPCFDHLFGRVVENVKPASNLSDDASGGGYDLYGFGRLNTSTGSSLVSSPPDAAAQRHHQHHHREEAPTTQEKEQPQHRHHHHETQLEACTTPTKQSKSERSGDGKGQQQKQQRSKKCCGQQGNDDDDCQLCYMSYSWPSSTTFYSQANQFQFQIQPVIDCCQCTPCQCTFDTNYCGCQSRMAPC